jgi:single-strand DNA-binding protein
MSTQVTILGNTGRDVELRYTPQGLPVANFSVASNTVRNTPQGVQKKTDWYNVTAFGKQAETLAKHLQKGASILVRGKLSLSAWETRSGEPRVNADVALQDFEFAGGGRNTGNSAAETEAASATGRNRRGDEIGGDDSDADDAITAEMLEALREAEMGGDEPFAGQF